LKIATKLLKLPTKEEILMIVGEVHKERKARISKGLFGSDLDGADYLKVIDRLREHYSIDEIMTRIFFIFGIDDLQYIDLDPAAKFVSLILISDLFGFKQKDLKLHKPCIQLLRSAMRKAPARHIGEIDEIAALDRDFNYSLRMLDTTANILPQNDEQYVAVRSKAYVDAVEGVYSIALQWLSFAVSILKDKAKTRTALKKLSVSDHLNIIRSYNKQLSDLVSACYQPVIRNATSHDGIDSSKFPMLTYKDKKKNARFSCSIEQLNELLEDLVNISARIGTAVSLSMIYPEGRNVGEQFENIPEMGDEYYHDVLRRFITGVR